MDWPQGFLPRTKASIPFYNSIFFHIHYLHCRSRFISSLFHLSYPSYHPSYSLYSSPAVYSAIILIAPPLNIHTTHLSHCISSTYSTNPPLPIPLTPCLYPPCLLTCPPSSSFRSFPKCMKTIVHEPTVEILGMFRY